jgi:hypothetical protein
MILIRIDPRQPVQRLQAVLDGVTYQIDLTWQSRDQTWRMNFCLADGTPILIRRPLLSGSWPLAGCVSPLRPTGGLAVVDLGDGYVDPGEFDLGDRVQLIYMTLEEIESA